MIKKEVRQLLSEQKNRTFCSGGQFSRQTRWINGPLRITVIVADNVSPKDRSSNTLKILPVLVVRQPEQSLSPEIPMLRTRLFVLTLLCCPFLCYSAPAAKPPLKIFVMAGQSNMEGHGHIRVLDYMKEDPATASLLAKMKSPDGSHRMIKDVWISYLTGVKGRIDGDNREVFGQLTAGYGAQWGRDYSKPGEKIGPELAFGITMQEGLGQPILIIKTAWGGQSIHTDFRSPSSGPYEPTEDDIARKRFETDEQKRKKAAATGARYRQMIEHVRLVLSDIKRVYPDYEQGQGYELAGFVWFQGFNDMVSRSVYPLVDKDSPTPRFAKYTEWFANFVRDVRKDLSVTELPFVIGVMGVGGSSPNDGNRAFRESQAAVAQIPEFKGNVLAVPTAPYWDEALARIDEKRGQMRNKAYHLRKKHPKHENADGEMTEKDIKAFLASYEEELFSEEELALEKRGKSNAGYHYLGSAKTYSLIGQACARALLEAGSEN